MIQANAPDQDKPNAPSTVLFLTGPSGAGKTVTALAWASSRTNACALIDHDGIRRHIKSGFVDPGVKWNQPAQQQWELARTICCDMTHRYTTAGVDCVVDAFSPPSEFSKWEAELRGIIVRIAVLLPTLEITLARNRQRVASARLREESIRENYSWMEAWKAFPDAMIIDNSHMSVEEVVEHIANIGAEY